MALPHVQHDSGRVGPGRVRQPVRPRWWAYVWWFVVGGCLGIGVVGILTIGIFFLAAGGALTAAALFLPAARTRSACTAIAGLAVAPGYIAWLNRSGPNSCPTSYSGGPDDVGVHRCTEMWSPWPFVVVAVLLVAFSGALIIWLRHLAGRAEADR